MSGDIIDKKLEKFGYIKTYECDTVVIYERDAPSLRGKYTERLELAHKANGRHMFFHYEKGINSDGYNNAVGIKPNIAKLAIKKMHKKGWI